MQSPGEDPATQVMTRAMGLVHVTDDTVGIGGPKAGTGFCRSIWMLVANGTAGTLGRRTESALTHQEGMVLTLMKKHRGKR